MDKKELRQKCLATRKNIPEKEFKSRLIYNEIISSPEYNDAQTIAIYNSTEDEVDTHEIIMYSFLKEKTILLPKIIGKEMIFLKVDNSTKYKLSKFGILEPITGDIYDHSQIDLFIIPGVAFDIKGNRLGYGAGYYDRYLQGNDVTKLGLAYEEQIINSIPTDEHDIQMDIVQTEKERYYGTKRLHLSKRKQQPR